MDKLHLIPLISLRDGMAVIHNRITGNTDAADPVDLAMELEELGFDELLLTDVTGALAGNFGAYDILNAIAANTRVEILTGGGLRDEFLIEQAFHAGASRILTATFAVAEKEKMLGVIDIYGGNSIVIGLDIDPFGQVIEGRTKKEDIFPEQLIGFYAAAGVNRFIVQSVDEAGRKIAPAAGWYENICSMFAGLRIYAGEGLDDVSQFGRLEAAGLAGLVIGDEFYTDEKLFSGLKRYMLG